MRKSLRNPVEYVYSRPVLLWSICIILFDLVLLVTGVRDVVMILGATLAVSITLVALRASTTGVKQGVARVLFVIGAALLMLIRISAVESDAIQDKQALVDILGTKVELEGAIVKQPLRRHSDQRLVIEVGHHGDPVRVLVYAPRFPTTYIGQFCEFEGILKQPEAFDGFDYPRYLAIRRIHYQIRTYNLRCTQISQRRAGEPVKNALFDLKTGFAETAAKNLPEPQASLLIGIIFGDKRVFENEFETSLRRTGTSHIIAASGYNVTLVILGVRGLLFFLGFKARTVVSLAAVWGFALLAGLEASIVRAALMGSVFLLGKMAKRMVEVNIVFWFSLAIFILINPMIIYDVGFQLSASATGGLIYLLPRLEKIPIPKALSFVANYIQDGILPTLAATVSTLPISVYSFGGFSLVALPVNIIVLPIIESTIFLGIAGILISYIPGLGFMSDQLFHLVYVQLRVFEIVVNWAGGQELAYYALDN